MTSQNESSTSSHPTPPKDSSSAETPSQFAENPNLNSDGQCDPNESKVLAFEDIGRLQYELAVELSRETSLQSFIRQHWIPFWEKVSKPALDIWKMISSNFTRFKFMGIRSMSQEFIRPILEIAYFPISVYDTFQTRAYVLPFQGVGRYFAGFRIHKEFKTSLKYSLNFFAAKYQSKWSRPGKIYAGGVALLTMFTLYHYKIRPWPKHDVRNEACCLHKTVIITGSSTGIGFRLAFEFAKRGAFVILTSPDMVKARKARLDLSRRLEEFVDRKRTIYIDEANARYYDQLKVPPTLDIEFLLHNIVELDLNLASTASIYSFSRKVQGMSPQGIDILINNASINSPPEEMVVTSEGKEAHFAINYFGHFILTHLLMGHLAKRKGSRIINITCKLAAEQGFIHIDKFIEPYLQEDGLPYLPAHNAYEDSKLAMFLLNRQLSKELKRSCINTVTTYCVCPGTTRTFIDRHMNQQNYFISKFWKPWMEQFYKKEFHAVQTILHCALSYKVCHESGFFYENNRRSYLRIRHKSVDAIAEELWNSSMALMKIGHNSMLKLTEQMHIRSHENIFQLGSQLFLHRRDLMTHLLLMEEQHAFKNAHKKFVNHYGDAREDFTYFWHGFYLAGGNFSGMLERWVLYNAHPGFRELQKEYDVWFECSGSSHFYPQANGKMASLQYMSSFPNPLNQEDIEDLEELYESESEPDFDMELKTRYHNDYIPIEEYIL